MKCKNCGGTLHYSPKERALLCDNCNNIESVPFDKFEYKHDISAKLQTSIDDKTIRCPNCGAKSNIGGASVCNYCGSTLIQDFANSIDAIVPFCIEKDEARKQYKKWVGNKFWAPIGLKKIAKAKRLQAYYIPTISFDAKTNTSYSGVKVETHTRRFMRNNIPVHETYETRRPFRGVRNDEINNVLVCKSKEISNANLSNVGPFDYTNLYKYDDRFVAGYNVENYNINEKEAHAIAKELIEEEIQDRIRAQEGANVESLRQNTVYLQESKARFLLPVYKSNYKYKNKNYDFYINGSNGRCCGNYPKSIGKITIAVLFLLAIIGVVLYLIIK